MSFIELVKSRQSVRKYSTEKIEPEKLQRCLEAGRLAPSASNSQPWTFVVIDDPGLKEKVALQTFSSVVSFNKFVVEAPVLIALILEPPKLITQIGGAIKRKKYPLIDIGIAAEHICLQASEEGLGTCMLGWFNQKPIQKLLNIPKTKNIGLIISIGYPVKDYPLRIKTRKPYDSVVRFNSY
ncbi:MAG: nitroreductase family protein [Bacteroidales bacterium]|nr:nitroreductase family protein [Bacteroidales bacterium]MCF8404953.1 nitroreductase family protein [Bacteroidales bacterium]